METMTLKSVVLITLVIATVACEEPEIVVQPEAKQVGSTCSTIILGDKDGFGMGLTAGSSFSPAAGTALPLDYRTGSDPLFSDIYPADLGNYDWPQRQIVYDVTFESPETSIVSVKFTALTLGIQDGDSQVYQSETDVKLYVDNTEVPNAFDEVDQFKSVDGNWVDIVSMVEIELPSNFFSLLQDGNLFVRLEILQLSPNCESYDAFAIDYFELQVCTEGAGAEY